MTQFLVITWGDEIWVVKCLSSGRSRYVAYARVRVAASLHQILSLTNRSDVQISPTWSSKKEVGTDASGYQFLRSFSPARVFSSEKFLFSVSALLFAVVTEEKAARAPGR